MRILLALIVATTTVGVTLITHQHKPAKTTDTLVVAVPLSARASRAHTREPLPQHHRKPQRRQHPRLTTAGFWADTTMYCSTGNRTASGRWPVLGDVAVLNRSIRFGARVLIAGVTGGDPGCEQRALDYGRRRLRVVVLP